MLPWEHTFHVRVNFPLSLSPPLLHPPPPSLFRLPSLFRVSESPSPTSHLGGMLQERIGALRAAPG